MRRLLDTHTLLWYFEDSDRLPDSIAAEIESAETHGFVSVASLWEFAIKHSMGKLHFDGGISAFWKMVTANEFGILQINEPYLIKLSGLPFLHRDPFDRLLVATAMVEDMAILTADESIRQYDVKCVWGCS
jgi:PIN domain nuclease of toxin-antitoxin system